jgi:Leucine-rich repeat (LRR) protein
MVWCNMRPLSNAHPNRAEQHHSTMNNRRQPRRPHSKHSIHRSARQKLRETFIIAQVPKTNSTAMQKSHKTGGIRRTQRACQHQIRNRTNENGKKE